MKNEDRLDMLRGKYLRQIDAKQSEINTLRQKVALLDELKAEADNLLPELDLSAEALLDAVKPDLNGIGLTDTVLKNVPRFGTKPFTPPDMRKQLLEQGYEPKGKNFAITVGTTLKRLAKQGKILKEHDSTGKTVYRAKP